MALVVGGLLPMQVARAQQDQTWLTTPATGDFNTPSNWSGGAVPTGVGSFGTSGTTNIGISAATTLGGLTFNSGAPAYTFTQAADLTLTGAGIVNNSSSSHTFIVGGNTLTFSGMATAGPASVSINATVGSITFNDSSSAGSANITSSGTGGQINFNDSSSAGNATIVNTNGSSLSFDSIGANPTTAGNATITNSAGGFMCFCNDATTGTANITNTDSGSTLRFDNNTGAGAATITNENGATVVFAIGGTSSTARYISSGGALDVSGLGTVGLGSIEGNGTVDLSGSALTLGSNNLSTAYSGVISGAGGSLIKTGSGTLTLSGANTYDDGTTVNQGALLVTGSLASGVTVNSGGVLGGTGTIAGNVINNGTVAPGTPGSPLVISNGNYTQNAGGTFQISITAAGVSGLSILNGTASLAGALAVQAGDGGFAVGQKYTVLTASGGVTGVFGSVTLNGTLAFAFLKPTLSYDANDAFLTLVQGANAFASGAQTGNQRAVGIVLDQASPTATGDFAKVLGSIAVLDSVQGPRTLDAISGQNYSGFSTAAVQSAQVFMNSFIQHVGGGSSNNNGNGNNNKNSASLRIPLVEAQACDATACDVTEPTKWGAWGGGIAGAGTVAGDASAHGVNYNVGGFAAGLDYRFDPQFLAGVTIGYTDSTQFTQGMDGRGTSTTVQAGLYGSYTEGAIYLDGLAGYAHGNNSLQRPIVIQGLQPRTALGNTTVDQFFGLLETGYQVRLGGAADAFVTPFARLQGSAAMQAAFSESGADSLDLNVAAQTTNSLRSVFGAQLGGGLDAGWREKLALVLRLGWSHEFADTSRPVTASFAGAPALSFTTQGAQAPRDGAVVGLSADTAIADSTRLYVRYDGDIAGGNTSHIFSAGVRMTW